MSEPKGSDRPNREQRSAQRHREAKVRGVVASAHEVCLHFVDSRSLFVHVVPTVSGAEGADSAAESFLVRPWGWTATKLVRFDELIRAIPVRQMTWQAQRVINAEQLAAFRRAPVASVEIGAEHT